jgi:Flp pilus assembly pilin Flp
MTRLRTLLISFAVPMDEDDRGSVATEYGLMLALITLAIIAAATAFGLVVADMFDSGGAAFPGP